VIPVITIKSNENNLANTVYQFSWKKRRTVRIQSMSSSAVLLKIQQRPCGIFLLILLWSDHRRINCKREKDAVDRCLLAVDRCLLLKRSEWD
jgi:hypothetical protein